MKFCSNCGNQIDDQAVVCTKCGVSVNAPATEGSTVGWGVLGFFIPIVGLILFLVWKSEKPRAAKSAGIGALISTIITVVFYILFFVLYGSLFVAMST